MISVFLYLSQVCLMREEPRETQPLIFPALNVVVNKRKYRSLKSLVAVHRYLLAKRSVTELF